MNSDCLSCWVEKVKMDLSVVPFIIWLLAAICVKAQEWSYEYQAKWYDDFQECSLNRQSPIEINGRDAIETFFMPPIEYHNYNVSCSWPSKIHNSGYGAVVDLPAECNRPQISGGPLPYNSIYEAESFHFHWGSQNHHGSEHVIDSRRYSLEAHIVHRNTKYSSIDEASQHPDGLAVQALLYKADLNQYTDFDGLQNVVAGLKVIRHWNSSALIENVILTDLFGNIDTSRFYTYQGSLTTPPCSQAVTWIVFHEVIDISQHQMEQFRLLSDIHGAALVNNYRFIQPKGERKVYFRSATGPYYGDYDYTNEI